jgi:hypothetical protein
MEYKLESFHRRQGRRLLELAETCEDRELQGKLIAIAKDWLTEAGEPLPEAGLLPVHKVPDA